MSLGDFPKQLISLLCLVRYEVDSCSKDYVKAFHVSRENLYNCMFIYFASNAVQC